MLRVVAAIACVVLSATAVHAKTGEAKISAALNRTALVAGEDAALAVLIEIPSGLHAQSHAAVKPNIALDVKMNDAAGVRFDEPVYPPGRIENYPALGTVDVYTDRVIVYVPMHVAASAKIGDVKIAGSVRYQMCDDRQCFFPKTTGFEVSSKVVGAGSSVQDVSPEIFSEFHKHNTSGAALRSATRLDAPVGVVTNATGPSWSIWFALGVAFVTGIVFNVMPCVLPVLPLKAMGFYEVSQHDRAKCLSLGLVFSLGIVASFAVLGLLVVALQVFKWGELFANAWFLAALVIVLVIMAASMFGVFTVNVPASVYRFTPRHDTYTGNFLFGILTAALSTPCTFGMFFGLLAWALAQRVIVGVAIMIVVGMGMAFPYLVLSAFPELARKFPRTGPWAETIKMLMGFLLLGTAAYFAGPFINRLGGEGAFWWVIFAIVCAAAIFLVWRTMRFSRSVFARAVAVVIALAMVLPAFYFTRLLTVKPYQWVPYSADALASAQREHRIVLVDFTADWCGNCHFVEAWVLNSRRVVKAVDDHNVVMIKADLSKDDAAGRPLLNQLNPVAAIPLTAIYAPGFIEPIQLNGIYSTRDLLEAIDRAGVSVPIAAAR